MAKGLKETVRNRRKKALYEQEGLKNTNPLNLTDLRLIFSLLTYETV